MNNLGFAVFGRPVQHHCAGNGLINDLHLGDSTYMQDLPDGVGLKPGETFAIIKRLTNSSNADLGGLMISIYEYAVSHNDRAGGFVGSAIAFMGNPVQQVFFTHFPTIHKNALTLLDSESRKFKFPTDESWNINLPNIDDSTLVSTSNIVKRAIDNKLVYGFRVSGSLHYNLLSIAQGFCSNSNFSTVSTLIVSSNEQFLGRLEHKSLRVLSLYNLLDYSNHYTTIQSNLANENETLKLKTAEHEKLVSELLLQSRHFNQLKKDLDVLKSDNESYTKQLSNKKSELDGINSNLQSAKHEESRLINYRAKSYKSFINGEFKDEYHKDKRRIEQGIKLEMSRVEEISNDSNSSRFRMGWFAYSILGVFGLMLIVLGFALGKASMNESQESLNKQVNQLLRELKLSKAEIDKLSLVKIVAPKEYTANEYFLLSESDKENHCYLLNRFIVEVSMIEDEGKYNLSNFFNRKWNFRELVIVDKDLKNSLVRIEKVQNVYRNLRKGKGAPNEYNVLGVEGEEFELAVSSIGSKRWDALQEYLNIEGNLYVENEVEHGSLKSSSDDVDNKLMMHFRWMLFECSDHSVEGETDHRDLYETRKKEHKTPVIKQK
jgi:hypothetical protein